MKNAIADSTQPVRVVIYARYSDSKQTENSIEGQIKTCKAYIESMGYVFMREYCDRAKTGRNDDRDGFKLMLLHSKEDRFDKVIVYALDRFGRNILQCLLNEKALNDNGVEVESATEVFDNSPQGRMARNIQMSVAQYYSEELAQKVQRGQQIKAKEAAYLGGRIPLGYRIENKRYVIDEVDAAIVREIFQKYADGWSYKQLCDDFNSRQIRTSKGAVFNKNSFHVILKNRRYLGIYIYDKIELPGKMPQIIDEKLFNEVAAKMQLNQKAPGRHRAKAEYLLTQKMYCGYCGEMMIGHSSNQVSTKGVIYNYYRCKNAGGSRPCKKKMIQKDYLEDLVIRECLKLLTEENIARIAKEVYEITQNDGAYAVVKHLENALKQKKKELENQMLSLRRCTDDMIRDAIFADMQYIKAAIQDLERQIVIEKDKCFLVTEEQIINRLTKLATGDIHNLVYRRSLIRIFVNKILIYDDKIILTFKTGDEDVVIPDILLNQLEEGLGNETLCLSEQSGHQKQTSRKVSFRLVFLYFLWHVRCFLNFFDYYFSCTSSCFRACIRNIMCYFGNELVGSFLFPLFLQLILENPRFSSVAFIFSNMLFYRKSTVERKVTHMPTLLIAEPSEYLCSALNAALRSDYEVHICNDGHIALEQINRLQPDALIINLSLTYLDGLTVVQKAYHTPSIILALSGLINPYVLHAAREVGITYVMPIPCTVDAVLQRLRALLPSSLLTHISPDHQAQTEDHLQALGFSCHMGGYKMLCLAMPMFFQDPQQSLSKELYPAITDILGHVCSRQSVERAIRSSILAAWKHRESALWKEYFPKDKKPPTNKQFIATIANKLKY